MSLPAGIEREIGHDSSAYNYGFGYGGSWLDQMDTPLDLLWPLRNQTFEKMGRDAKVREVLQSVFLPIQAARWSLDPNGARPQVVTELSTDLGLPIRGAESVQPTLRVRDRFQWAEHLQQVILMLKFGHMPFEQVYRIDEQGLARIRKLAPRLPSSISKINVAPDGGLESILQYRNSGTGEPIPIPVNRLVWYANERDGGAWQGRSVLEAAYRPWRLKEEALRVWATSLRRNGIGQPIYHGAPGEGQASLNQGRELARRARAGEATGVAVPHGADLSFEGVRGTLPDHEAFVRMQDEQIAACVLAEFLKLGSSKSGSRALGTTFVDFFTLGLQAVAEQVCTIATAHIVEDWVDLNYGPDEQAPKIAVDGVGTDHRLTPEQLAGLLASGVLSSDPALEDYVRTEMYHLPARDPQAPPAPTVAADSTTVSASVAPPAAAVISATTHRDSNPSELAAKTDFTTIGNSWQQELNVLLPLWRTQRDLMLGDLLEQVRVALEAGDLNALATLEASTGAGAVYLDAAMRNIATAAGLEAQAEATRQGATVLVPEVDVASITARAHVVDELMARALVDVVTRQALLRWVEGSSASTVQAEIWTHLEGLTDQYLIDQLGGALTAAQNQARFAVMATGPVSEVYASELLDTATCVNCADRDETQYPTLAAGELDYPTGGYKNCLGGPRCRGTLVVVYATESPATIAARVSAEVIADALLRMPAPVVHVAAPTVTVEAAHAAATARTVRTIERDANGDMTRIVEETS
jgi:hypothetical protein